MNAPREAQLNACLDRITEHIQHLRQLDLSEEADLWQALEESQRVLGTLALYRGLLERTERHPSGLLRRAA